MYNEYTVTTGAITSQVFANSEYEAKLKFLKAHGLKPSLAKTLKVV